MKSVLIALVVGGTAAAAAGATTPIEPSDVIAFMHDSNVLDADGVDQADRAAQWLRAHPDYTVVLVGHTDETGDPDYNAGLAFARAASVKARLGEDGIKADRIVLVSFGERAEHDRRVVVYATRAPGHTIATNAMRRGAARATWFHAGSTFDMAPGS